MSKKLKFKFVVDQAIYNLSLDNENEFLNSLDTSDINSNMKQYYNEYEILKNNYDKFDEIPSIFKL